MKIRLILLACAVVATAGCGSSAPSLSPSSLTGPAASFAAQGAGPSDYHETPDADPAPLPGADPAPLPGADPAPAPGPTPLGISIVGSFGSGAFMPNPIQAAAGDLVQWTNNDASPHHLVLGDGTDVGRIEPGMSSVPIALATAAATYRCTLHPSMIGSITDAAAPTMPPVEEPPYMPPYEPPDDDYYY